MCSGCLPVLKPIPLCFPYCYDMLPIELNLIWKCLHVAMVRFSVCGVGMLKSACILAVYLSILLYIALDASLINNNLYQPLALSIAEGNPERLKTSV